MKFTQSVGKQTTHLNKIFMPAKMPWSFECPGRSSYQGLLLRVRQQRNNIQTRQDSLMTL